MTTAATLIIANRVVLPGGEVLAQAFVTVSDGRIRSIDTKHPASFAFGQVLECDLLVPGFFDLHNHGIGGECVTAAAAEGSHAAVASEGSHAAAVVSSSRSSAVAAAAAPAVPDVLEYWLSDASLRALPALGVTSVLASLTFPSDRQPLTERVIDRLNAIAGVVREGLATVEGIHAEGPIIATCGGLCASDSEMPLPVFISLVDRMKSLKIMTISPSLEEKIGYRRLRVLLERGVLPALGHDAVCSEKAISGALVAAGDRRLHMTHVFNVQKFHHRDVGLANFALLPTLPALPSLAGALSPTVELIGDCRHVHPVALGAVLAARSPSHICFISDAIAAPPERDEEVLYAGRRMLVNAADQTVTLPSANNAPGPLAGSCVSLLHTLKTLVDVLHVPIGQAVMMLTETPAKIANVKSIGRIQVGHRADLLLLSPSLTLTTTLINGKVAYVRDEAKL